MHTLPVRYRFPCFSFFLRETNVYERPTLKLVLHIDCRMANTIAMDICSMTSERAPSSSTTLITSSETLCSVVELPLDTKYALQQNSSSTSNCGGPALSEHQAIFSCVLPQYRASFSVSTGFG